LKPCGSNPPLIIVDSPGFGDTKGINVDFEIIGKIKSFFENKIETINAVCFVAKSTENRLTPS
jgi:hypothetical protein